MSSPTIIKLKSELTGEKVEFKIRNELTSAFTYKISDRDELVEQMAKIGEKGKDLSKEEKTEFSKLYSKSMKLGLDGLCMILDPVKPLNEKYDTKRELIAECIKNDAIVGVVVELFYDALSGSTASLKASEYREKAKQAVEVVQ